MSAVKTVGCILVISLIVFLHARHTINLTEARQRIVLHQRQQIEGDIRRLEARIAERSGECANLNSSLSALEPAAAPTRKAAPETSEARWARFKAGIHRRYQRFFELARLPPEQIDAFEVLLIDRQKEIDAQCDAPDRATDARALVEQIDNQFQAPETRLLGDANFHILQQFERVQPLQTMIEKVTLGATDLSAVMSSDQKWALAEILASASVSYQAGGKVDPDTIDWSVALARARSVLSPAQWDGLKTMSDRNQLDRLRKQFFHE